MATEKQIAANRANAKRSTGPKTAAGRKKSSRNAHRHGLSRDLPMDDPVFRARMNSLAEVFLDGEEPTDENLAAAAEAADAQVQLLRIREVRTDMLKDILRQRQELQDFSRLVALDRYTRLAHTKRRRASQKLTAAEKTEDDDF
jgi:hypothetical protein